MHKHNKAARHAKDQCRRKQDHNSHHPATYRRPMAQRGREINNEATNKYLEYEKFVLRMRSSDR